MNNDQFRKLVMDTPARQSGAAGSPNPSATPSTLGSKRTSFVPMTPRTLVKGGIGVDFARQVAERNAAGNPAKKFKSRATPRGAKLAAGYKDRTLEREQEEADDKAERIKALEEQMKLGQIDRAMFEKMRDQIAGGDVTSTHLVKGLDRQLLEKVRRGEDVLNIDKANKEDQGPDVDDEFEALAEQEIAPVEREKAVKKGEMAPPPPPIAGVKRSRDAIMAELKAQRAAAAEARFAARPDLGAHFRSIEQRQPGQKVVKDAKGREVLITKDEHGNIKRKVRKVAPVEEVVVEKPKYLDEGVTIPQLKQQQSQPEPEEDSDDDIFEGAGTAYNPLGDEQDEDDSDEELERAVAPADPLPGKELGDDEDEGEILEAPIEPPRSPSEPAKDDKASMPPPPRPSSAASSMPPPPIPSSASSKPRNYFKTDTTSASSSSAPQNPMSDPNFLDAIKRAGSLANFRMQLDSSSKEDGTEESAAENEARLRKRAAMLASSDRDLEDMDLGFGSSRFGDDDEGEEEGGKKIKLSEWKGTAGDDDEDDKGGKGKGAGKKRSRRRKGDKESAKDVLGVLERRNAK